MSPYLKSLSMVAANKLLHLLEAFSTTWFLFSAVQNHHLVFFLLEVFNNIIQYQFDGKKLLYSVGVRYFSPIEHYVQIQKKSEFMRMRKKCSNQLHEHLPEIRKLG